MNFDDRRVGLAFISRRQQNSISYNNRSKISSLIREALIEGGLGKKDPDVPMADIISPGMTVLLKPNWVLHYNQSGKGMDCMITHKNFIEAVLKEILKAKPKKVIIGDAPIQSTEFEIIANRAWQAKIKSIAASCHVDIIDFRRSIWEMHRWGGRIKNGPRDLDCYTLYNLKSESLLETISTPSGRFRNTCYDHNSLIQSHRPGCHKYLLSRELFESDVVINLPKLKAHRKAGITGALKNLVGICGDKDYLPHHRIGGSENGGDCYKGKSVVKRIAEFLTDYANRNIGKAVYYPLVKGASLLKRLNGVIYSDNELEGGWYGNDTVWRMALDLNRLAMFGRKDGSLSNIPLRRIYSLTDGIIAGEGFGPLAPEPVKLGVVTFSSSTAFADLAHTALMRFNWENIPLIKYAFSDYRYPITRYSPEDIRLFISGNKISLKELTKRYGMDFKPPNGWKNHIEIN